MLFRSGPERCSGLDITQYSEDSIKEIFRKKFDHIKSFEKVHVTPFGTEQSFLWNIFKRMDGYTQGYALTALFE